MTNRETRKDFETIGEAARRLLGGLERRANSASGGTQRPEQIQDSTSNVPAVPSRKEAGQESAKGVAARHPGRPVVPVGQSGEKGAEAAGGGSNASATALRGEEVARGRLGVAAKVNGRPVFSAVTSFSVRNANDDGLPSREDAIHDRTREVYTLPAVKW